jgi:DNA-binding CsgD family transcriptional regulator
LQTVKNHLSRVYRKLGVPNRVQLAVLVVHESQTALKA